MTNKIEVEHLYKVFGNDPEAAVNLAREGADKDEIYRRTTGVVAVNDVSFTIKPQEVFVVMGLSGSGKSTLIRHINRLIEPTSGVIRIDGDDVAQMNREQLRQVRLTKMAMVFQHFALLPHLTVGENAGFALKLRGVSQRERHDKAQEALDAVGLGAWGEAMPDNLSGGMRQRVGLARALAVDPDILLMDEPFSALDPLIRRDMQDEMLQLRKRYRSTIVFITHDLNEALKIGDRIAIMKDGAFVQVGTPSEIVTAPADDYVAAFTQDVDRARVLSLGAIMENVNPLVLGQDDFRTAKLKMARAPVAGLPVVDQQGRFKGLLVERDLSAARDSSTLEQVMRDGPAASADTIVFDAFGAIASGMPVTVVDDNGRVSGMVQPQDVLSQLAAPGDEDEVPARRLAESASMSASAAE